MQIIEKSNNTSQSNASIINSYINKSQTDKKLLINENDEGTTKLDYKKQSKFNYTTSANKNKVNKSYYWFVSYDELIEKNFFLYVFNNLEYKTQFYSKDKLKYFRLNNKDNIAMIKNKDIESRLVELSGIGLKFNNIKNGTNYFEPKLNNNNKLYSRIYSLSYTEILKLLNYINETNFSLNNLITIPKENLDLLKVGESKEIEINNTSENKTLKVMCCGYFMNKKLLIFSKKTELNNESNTLLPNNIIKNYIEIINNNFKDCLSNNKEVTIKLKNSKLYEYILSIEGIKLIYKTKEDLENLVKHKKSINIFKRNSLMSNLSVNNNIVKDFSKKYVNSTKNFTNTKFTFGDSINKGKLTSNIITNNNNTIKHSDIDINKKTFNECEKNIKKSIVYFKENNPDKKSTTNKNFLKELKEKTSKKCDSIFIVNRKFNFNEDSVENSIDSL